MINDQAMPAMISAHVFDVWADGYDEDVRLCDEKNEYPFAGYSQIMSHIYAAAMAKCPAKVLDVGVGTGNLAAKLHEQGNRITGLDFSPEMLAIAQPKMPDAALYQCDFAQGLPPELAGEKFDCIISTYALHHFPDDLKATFIKSLVPHLNDNGVILIGDIGFPTRAELLACMGQNEDGWDDSEYYFVFTELSEALSGYFTVKYEQVSHCSGIMELQVLLP